MGEQHLDALSIVARLFERLGLAECPSDIAGLLVDTARDLARRLLRTAPHLERADVAVELAGSVKQQVVIHDLASAREGLSRRTGVDIALLVEGEGLPAEGTIVALRLVDHRDMRRDLLVVDEPVECWRRAVGRVSR